MPLHVTSGIRATSSNYVALGNKFINNQMFKCTERRKEIE